MQIHRAAPLSAPVLVFLLASASFLSLPSAAASGAPGIGSARASAIPIRAAVAGVPADLLDVSMAATTDPQRNGKSRRTAESSLTAMRIGGPHPVSAGEVSTSAVEGEAKQDSTADVPLSEPGLVTATLQTANATSMVDETGSYASAGASLSGISLGNGLVEIDAATASLSVSATATSVSASKILDIPVVTALRVGDLAAVAGIAIDALSVEALLSIVGALSLEATGTLGDALAQQQEQAGLVEAVHQQLAAAGAELDAAQALHDGASATLAESLAALGPAQQARDEAGTDLDAAQTELTAAESAHASAAGALQDVQADQQTLNSLTLFTPDAVATLQALADTYGVVVEVSGLNFLTALMSVADAVAGAAAAAELAEANAAAALAGAQSALEDAQAALSAAESALAALESTVAAYQADLAVRAAAVASVEETVAALEATLAGLQSVLSVLVSEIAGSVTELRALVEGASIVSFEGIHIELHASASAAGGSPSVAVAFDRLSLGSAEAAQNVSGVEAAATLLPAVAAAVNGVGAAFGLPVFDVGMLMPSSASGIDGDGYRYASSGFSLLRVSVPTPDGHELMLEVGDPEVFAEFAPATAGGSPPQGKPKPPAGKDPATLRLPSTGVPGVLPGGILALVAALAAATGLLRRREP